jgi:hypothetical protein
MCGVAMQAAFSKCEPIRSSGLDLGVVALASLVGLYSAATTMESQREKCPHSPVMTFCVAFVNLVLYERLSICGGDSYYLL